MFTGVNVVKNKQNKSCSYRCCPLNSVGGRIAAQNGGEDSFEEPHVPEDCLVEEVGVWSHVLEAVHLDAAAKHWRLTILLLNRMDRFDMCNIFKKSLNEPA